MLWLNYAELMVRSGASTPSQQTAPPVLLHLTSSPRVLADNIHDGIRGRPQPADTPAIKGPGAAGLNGVAAPLARCRGTTQVNPQMQARGTTKVCDLMLAARVS